jgi:very-short-patch-repair endonuclease
VRAKPLSLEGEGEKMDQPSFARYLRQNMTEAERLAWHHLRAHRLQGQKFRRQQPIGPYIVDFVHFGARLIVEADGGQHNASASDAARDVWLKSQGFTVLRFWNNEILLNIEAVLETIVEAIGKHATLSPSPSPSRERGKDKCIDKGYS